MTRYLAKSGGTRSVGILGGSFDPPHAGHLHITKAALRIFDLDEAWWLVSPGNPLKARGPAPFERRFAAAQEIVDHPRIKISDFEAQQGTRYTAQTLRLLFHTYPRTRFVWLMGADNLVQFDQWQDWRAIMESIPVGVFARPGDRQAALRSKAATIYRKNRLKGRKARKLASAAAPAWAFVNLSMMAVSSTQIRAKGEWSG